ncbi:hypothetical protein H632_c416p1 [Helicosporidium sp. ATCC 50920]|nr:hypothetical protein H632_c416p1 [Helicosporidium sp. ATCC 50920]|eukprot:KDD75964.1 hypothetical protein H632_c416p1 [Helicosporidium sp. ATCC 50920]
MPETAQTSLPEASTAGASEAAARTNPPDADEPSAAASSASLLPAPDDASLPPLASLLTCPEWRAALRSELAQPYFRELSAFLDSERAKGRRIFPPPADTFRALNECPPCRVRAVILGQDPYHGEGQAMGLSFSVRRGVPVPSSLQNIHKELLADLGCPRPAHGCLQAWARQRVLLLNAVLSVRAHEAASHAKRGWERFTDAVVRVLSRDNPGAVFLLWGRHAQEKGRAIQSRDRHLVLASAHPSGLSAHRGFFGCRHFSKTNDWLRARGEEPIDWRIPP